MTTDDNAHSWHYARGLAHANLRLYSQARPTDDVPRRVLLFDPYTDPHVIDTLEKVVLDLPRDYLDVDLLILRELPSTAQISTLDQVRVAVSKRIDRNLVIAVLRFPFDESGFLTPILDYNAIDPDSGDPSDSCDHDCINPDTVDTTKLVNELCGLEIRAFLQWSSAILTPAQSHFELPSGNHAASFIRVADTFTDITSIRRFTDWLQPLLTRNCVLVGDTWTILPLLQELAGRVYKKYEYDPPIVTFQSYPSLAQFEQVFSSINPLISTDLDARVLFVVSVASSHNLARSIKDYAPKALRRNAEIRIVSLVDTGSVDDVPALVKLSGFQRYDVSGGDPCELCRDPRKRPVIRIDPKRYAPIIEGSVQLEMLSAKAAGAHRDFWEIASRTGAIKMHVDDFSTGSRRHLPVAFDVAKLLSDNRFRRSIIRELRKHTPLCDMVIIPEHPASEALEKLAKSAYHNLKIVFLPRITEPLEDAAADKFAAAKDLMLANLRDSQHILILDDVVINGTTIRAVHRLLQEVITKAVDHQQPPSDYEIHAFVVLGRPASNARWKRLTASLRQSDEGVHLGYGRLLFISDDATRCPWCIEATQLQEILVALSDPPRSAEIRDRAGLGEEEFALALTTIGNRLAHLRPGAPDSGIDRSIFLSRSDGTQYDGEPECLSPHSLFGERLSETSAFAAVASALQDLRDSWSTSQAHRHAWNVPRVLTAYHDPLLSASFLRAAFAEEIVSGDEGPDFEDALAEISFASPQSDLRQSPILASEIEWAVLMGVLPQNFGIRIRRRIEPILDQAGTSLSAMMKVIRAVRAPM